MAYFFTIFFSVVFVVLAIFSIILSYMDSKRMRAFISARTLKEHLDVIVRFIVDQTNEQNADPDSLAQLQSLTDRYSGLIKKKDAFETIQLTNSIVDLYKSLRINPPIPDDYGAREKLGAALEIIGILRFEYNDCVERLNKMLDKRALAIPGKLFRMKKLETLCDISGVNPGV